MFAIKVIHKLWYLKNTFLAPFYDLQWNDVAGRDDIYYKLFYINIKSAFYSLSRLVLVTPLYRKYI